MMNPPSARSPPTKNQVVAALVSMCDFLLAVPAVAGDATMSSKLKAIKNYADTLFGGGDLARLRTALEERPALVAALRASDVDQACHLLESGEDPSESLTYALQCVAKVHPTMPANDVEALWDEVHFICDLAA